MLIRKSCPYLIFYVKFTCLAYSKFVGAHSALDHENFADPCNTVLYGVQLQELGIGHRLRMTRGFIIVHRFVVKSLFTCKWISYGQEGRRVSVRVRVSVSVTARARVSARVTVRDRDRI